MIGCQGNMWLRGHSNIGESGFHTDYKLESSLFRLSDNLDSIKALENSYLYEFMTKGFSIHQNKDEWDLLYLMQHHGTPTRLLDWSSSLSIALYFASRNWDPDKNTPCIWLLNPAKLNMSLKNSHNLVLPHGDYFSYVKGDLSSQAIAPFYNSPRLIAQHGQFTLQGNTSLDLEEELKSKLDNYNEILLKVELRKELYRDVKSYLHMNGINDYTVFPDLDGLSKLIKSRKGLYEG